MNHQGNDDNKDLIKAAKEGHLETVKALIEAGADLNITDKRGRTALMTAIFGNYDNSRVEIINMLIEAGADLDIQDYKGNTALMYANAGSLGQTLLLEKLIKYGADVSIKNNVGWNALYLAALNGRTEIVKLLIKSGAKASLKDDNFKTVLKQRTICGATTISIIKSTFCPDNSKKKVQNQSSKAA